MLKTIYVLKRSNGFIGIYVDGKKQENLTSNFSQRDHSDVMFSHIAYEINKIVNEGNNYQMIFTTNEEEFRSNLPTLSEFLGI